MKAPRHASETGTTDIPLQLPEQRVECHCSCGGMPEAWVPGQADVGGIAWAQLRSSLGTGPQRRLRGHSRVGERCGFGLL